MQAGCEAVSEGSRHSALVEVAGSPRRGRAEGLQGRVPRSRRKAGTQARPAEAAPSAAVAEPDHWIPVGKERASGGRCHTRAAVGVELVLKAKWSLGLT